MVGRHRVGKVAYCATEKVARNKVTGGRWCRLGFALVVVGCNTIDNGLDNSVSRDQHDPLDSVRNVHDRAQPGIGADAGDGRVAKTSGPWIYPGEEREPALADTRIAARAFSSRRTSGAIIGVNGVELNFENVDIPTVAKAILVMSSALIM